MPLNSMPSVGSFKVNIRLRVKYAKPDYFSLLRRN
uniref:Uncharacterized protein n=1 Tax=Lepeophtheirus salmonis TaxID=72036 RepID=A0A0K2U1V9_LEPSM